MISLLPNCSVKSGSINVIPKQKGGGYYMDVLACFCFIICIPSVIQYIKSGSSNKSPELSLVELNWCYLI